MENTVLARLALPPVSKSQPSSVSVALLSAVVLLEVVSHLDVRETPCRMHLVSAA